MGGCQTILLRVCFYFVAVMFYVTKKILNVYMGTVKFSQLNVKNLWDRNGS